MKASAACRLSVSFLALPLLPAERCADAPRQHVLSFSRSREFEPSTIREKAAQAVPARTLLAQAGPGSRAGIFTPEALAPGQKAALPDAIRNDRAVGGAEADVTPDPTQTRPEAGTVSAPSAPTPPSTAAAPANVLSEAEKAAGWQLLFNGTDFTGWHNFKQDGVRSGWQVRDGAMVCVDPHTADDLVTTQAFGWFELELDYNIAEGGNSGIMYHVTDAGPKMWSTGPEFQLLDNEKGAAPQRCGWLYGLYAPPVDPATGKILDATRPAGQWNHVRLLVSPARCEHDINGRKYFDYVLGSDDFKARVARSKFGKMPGFAAAPAGWIGLQGDHGSISFRNIKIRPLPEGANPP